VYAHTNRDFLGLINEIESIAADNPAKKTIGIAVVSPEHWPMPWYLRDYPNVGYWGSVAAWEKGSDKSEPIVIALEPQVPQMERLLDGKYSRYSTHELRPGNTLVMFLRNGVKP
jgi:predicted membrane-bound mannosyltransferase